MSRSSLILWLLCICGVGLLPTCREPVPSAGDFDATLQLGPSDLWVAGQRIRSRRVPVSCRRGELTFHDRELHRKIRLSSEASEDDRLMDRYWARRHIRGWEPALEVLRASPLVEDVQVSAEGARVKFKNSRGVVLFPVAPEGTRTKPNPYAGMSEGEILEAMNDRRIAAWNAGYLNLTQDIQKHLDGLSVGMLVVVSHHGPVGYFANQMRTIAEAQLVHVAHGGSWETLPEGPFTRNDVILRQVSAAASR